MADSDASSTALATAVGARFCLKLFVSQWFSMVMVMVMVTMAMRMRMRMTTKGTCCGKAWIGGGFLNCTVYLCSSRVDVFDMERNQRGCRRSILLVDV